MTQPMESSSNQDRIVITTVTKGGETTVSTNNNANQHKEGENRDRFNSYFEYVVSVLGYAAGFGSVWRFPYLVYKNGGGVFLIPYMIMLAAIGIPSFYFETVLGQMYQSGPPKCFEKIHKKWKGLGVFPLLTAFGVSTFYNSILGYSLYFLYESFSSPLPWVVAPDSTVPWNMEYFYNDVLHFSKSIGEIGEIVWPLLFCYVISQFIVYLCIAKGVSLSGKVATFTATSPYVLLLVLFIRGLFLEGSFSGLAYLFTPDWDKLWDSSVWVDAANQAIFQVSTGGGVLVIFGSYRPKSQEIIRNSIVIPVLTVMCGFLAAMVIFCFMGYMSTVTGIPFEEIPLRGPDLAFIVFPAVLTKMPFSNILSVIFFLTMVFLGLDTQFAFMDGIAGALEDELEGKGLSFFSGRIKIKTSSEIRALACGTVACFSLLYCTQAGFHFLDLVDGYVAGFNLFMGLFIETVFFTWVEKWETLEREIRTHVGETTPPVLIWLIKYSVPISTAVLGLLSLYYQCLKFETQPLWCSLIGWAIFLYPYYIVYVYYVKHSKSSDLDSKQKSMSQSLLDTQQELENIHV